MYSNNNRNHPLPPPPSGQQQQQQQQQEFRPQQRTRAQTGFSLRSHKSSGSGQKIDLHETHEEKKHLTTHADPSMAMTELEPSAVARQQSSLASIRAITHKDHLGNPIADPDRSNPTRNRWERPLDTIRSFEAAIDGNYRKSYIRNDSDGPANFNRRSSYFGGTQITMDERSRFPQNGQSGFYGRSQSQRPDSYVDSRASYFNQGDNGQGPSNGYYPNRSRYPRTASEPQFNNGKGIYHGPNNHQSNETVGTASGNGSYAEGVGYSTDPSSENSSVDRIAPLPTREPGENYGFIGFNGTEEKSQISMGTNPQSQRQGYGVQRPTILRKDSAGPRVPIKLSQTSGNAGPPPPQQRPAPAEKRKSWFGKRFSKSG